jgi:hypothetical protein
MSDDKPKKQSQQDQNEGLTSEMEKILEETFEDYDETLRRLKDR